MQLIEKYRARASSIPPGVPTSPAGLLGRVIADLKRLNHDTEQEFLKIGGKLIEYMQTVSAISSDLGTLANSGGGEHVSLALTHALDRASEMSSALGDGDGSLNDMRTEVVTLKRMLTGFDRTVSTFHTLALLTRIETARIGSEGGHFESVADDVSELAGEMQTRVGIAMTIAETLIPSIESAIREISGLEAGQAISLPALVSRSSASLASVRDIQDKANESSARLQSQYAAISRYFNKLIVSVQFHDITRQQIEHVIEVLQDLCVQCEGDGGAISAYPRGISTVLALQSAQLADAGNKFATSVAAVERSLEEVARHVVEMSRESRALAGIAEGGRGPIFLSMEQDFAAILTSLNSTANTGSTTCVARKDLERIIGQMREPIEEIKKIELEMRRIALNARISAGNLGSAGITLDVVAGFVQQLASECRERSESLSSMNWAGVGEHPKDAPDSSGGTIATDGTMHELRLAIEDMHTSSERGFALMPQIVARSESLAAELVAVHDGFSAGPLFANTIREVQAAFAKIEEHAQPSLRQGENNEPKTGFAHLAGHYTMQAERDVHDAVYGSNLGSGMVVAPAKEIAAPPQVSDELGDNVELF